MIATLKYSSNFLVKSAIKYRLELLLAFIWIIASLLVNPTGNFPVNDDWAYARNVYYLSEHGVLKFSDWPAMTLIAQMVYGTLFCKLFGFSFEVLRFSGVLLGFGGIVLVYRIVKELIPDRTFSFYAALTICFNPLYFLLSHSFMTDVPFLVAMLASFHFFLLYSKNWNSHRYYVLALIFSVLATLIRQTGVLLPIAIFAGYFLIHRQLNYDLIKYFLACIITILVLILFVKWLSFSGNLSANFSAGSELFKQGNWNELSQKLWKRSYILLFYYGLFLLPFLILLLKSYLYVYSWRKNILLILGAILICTPVLLIWDEVPVWNILNFHDLGPRLLKDLHWGVNLQPGLPNPGIVMVKVMATTGSFLLVFYTLSLVCNKVWKLLKVSRMQSGKSLEEEAFFIQFASLIVIVAYWIFLLLGAFFFDRYFIFLIPFFIILFLPGKVRYWKFSKFIAIMVFMIYAGFSVLASRDFFSWNRTRWLALNNLISEGISPGQIDGGFEFNGWYETGSRNEDIQPGKSWWFVKDDKYLIASGDFKGYRKIKKYTFKNYMSFRDDSLFVLRRIENFAVDTFKLKCNAELDTSINGLSYLKTTIDSLFCENSCTLTGISCFSGEKAVLTNKDHPFGFTIELYPIMPYENIRIRIRTKYNRNNAVLVVSSLNPGDFYQSGSVKDTLNPGTWKIIDMMINQYAPLPSALKIYAWNPSNETVLFDDLTIERYVPCYSGKAQ